VVGQAPSTVAALLHDKNHTDILETTTAKVIISSAKIRNDAVHNISRGHEVPFFGDMMYTKQKLAKRKATPVST
jgi:hypothetical protein